MRRILCPKREGGLRGSHSMSSSIPRSRFHTTRARDLVDAQHLTRRAPCSLPCPAMARSRSRVGPLASTPGEGTRSFLLCEHPGRSSHFDRLWVTLQYFLLVSAVHRCVRYPYAGKHPQG